MPRIEPVEVSCPFCSAILSEKIIGEIYLISNSCPKCGASPEKIENKLNRSNKRGYIKTEKSYIKLDPRG